MKLYLITNTHSHVSGIYYLPPETIANETGIRIPHVHTLLHTLSHVKVDTKRMVVWVEKMLHHQARGQKAYQAAAKQLANLHNSPLIKDFLIGYPQVRRYCTKALLDTLSAVAPLKEEEEEEKTPLPLVLNSSEVGKEKKKRLKKPEIPIPDDWVPNDHHVKLAGAIGLQLNMEASLFKGKAQEKQWVTADWDLKFKNWMIQEVKYRQERRAK